MNKEELQAVVKRFMAIKAEHDDAVDAMTTANMNLAAAVQDLCDDLLGLHEDRPMEVVDFDDETALVCQFVKRSALGGARFSVDVVPRS